MLVPYRAFTKSLQRQSLVAVLAACVSAAIPAAAVAGGGPENVLLVVNRRSSDSMTIANHYMQLRRIPAGNVLTLSWQPKFHPYSTDVDTFRK